MSRYIPRQRLQPLLPASTPSPSSTTDDIPPPIDPNTTGQPPRLTRHATDPASSINTSAAPLPIFPPPAGKPAPDAMTGNATITFSQTGVQPPVYVTTSLNGWNMLEMDVEDKTASDNIVFSKEFHHVPEGSHQYKIRLGEDHWILDESKETAADDQGIRNNVIQVVEPSPEPPAKPSPVSPKRLSNSRKDSTQDPSSLPEIPTVVIEKTDDKPAYGEDFGEDATNTQKVAHDMRAADASPDKLVIAPESDTEPDLLDEEAAPLFRHESFQVDESSATPLMGTIDEESMQSSADHTSSGDAMDTPSDPEDARDGDKLQQEPLFSHGTDLGEKNGELKNGPHLPHEAEIDEVETDEDEDADELDRHPLLSHESGFSDSKGSEIVTKSDVVEDEENQEPQHYRPYDDDEDDYPEGDEDDAPLLPHEREAARPSNAGSDMSSDDGHFSLQNQPTFGYETDNSRELFGPGRSNFFKSRTNSSCLPHKLPRSDEEDDNLKDPGLERFPTHREQILERVATIGHHLPEDDSMQDHPLSPQLSQACSSVDLAPVKSYTSLASVPEADDSDEEEEEEEEEEEKERDGDADSLGSPVFINATPARMPNTTPGVAGDSCATPMADDSKQLGMKDDTKSEAQSNRTADSSEADSIDKHDGAKDSSVVPDGTSTPQAVTSETKSTGNEVHSIAELDSELRQRRAQVEDSSETPKTPSTNAADGATIKDKIASAISPTLAQQPDKKNENYFQHFLRVMFGPVGRFLTACVGTRKRASASVTFVFGVAAVVYYVKNNTQSA